MTKSFSEIFSEFVKLNNIYCGKILKGIVISINKDFVLVDSGLKSESYIPIEEFFENDKIEVKIGDEIDVLLDSVENGNGKTILSRKKAKFYKSWTNLENFYKNNITISGKIIEKVKGGFIVLLENIKAFLPGSLIDFRSMNSDIVGKELDLRIIKLDKKNNNIILSRKIVLDLENRYNKEEFLNKLKENDIVLGIVKNITDYGVFIDLGYIDGLLHITDITWKRIKHPSEIVSIGDEIELKVLKFDKNLSKVSLGLKQLTDDPWNNILEKYPKNTKIFGKVTNLTDYGFFVEIESGIEGLVHVSEIDWKYKNIHPSKIVKHNDIIEVMILDINKNNRRISLGLKQCKDNPLKLFSKNHNIGEKIYGIVKSITDFGIFLELESGIDGLIHLVDISWSINPKNDLVKYNKGDKILAIILQIDINKYRLNLGIKQLTSDPFLEYIKNNKDGDIINADKFEINNNKLFVYLSNEILGVYNIKEYNFNINKINLENKKIKFKIIGHDKKLRLINLDIIDIKNVIENISNDNKSNIMTEAFKFAKNK